MAIAIAADDRQAEAAGSATTRVRWRQLRSRAFVIAGLSSVAVAQPLLDLFGNNPEFFVAGNYSTGQIVWFALIVTLLPPVIGVGVTATATAFSQRAGTIAFSIVVGILGAAFALVVLRSAGVNPVVVVLALAILGGAAAAVLALRTLGGRLLLSYLSAANLLFLGMFVFSSPASKLIAGSGPGTLGTIAMPEVRGPVVVIVLDEFPAATIMRPDGTVNDERYPGFAELASVSSWFRNASTSHNLTHRAVPSLLDGRLAEDGSLPTFDDHPRNLFTLLGSAVPVFRYESVTSLCPSALCEPPPRRALTQALEDASIVYGHRVLPAAWRDELPPIDNSWGAYGAQDDRGVGSSAQDGDDGGSQSYIAEAYSRWHGLEADERSPLGQARVLSERTAAITADPALHFVHVAIPHRPWFLSPTGVATSWAPPLIRDADEPAFEFEMRMEYQLHSMQVGAADALIGDVVDHLRSLPTWDDTLIVVTSDHGTNLTPPDIGRMRVTDENIEEVFRVPLFIKAPGQTSGEVRDEPALAIDVVPSIVDLLDIDVDWSFDGHSLFDGSVAHTEPRVSPDVEAVFDIARRRAEQFPHGDDWIALAATGPNGDLVGRDVDDFTIGDASAYTAVIDQRDEFASLPTASGEMPFAMSGTIEGRGDVEVGEPPELLVAINGRFAGVIGGYTPSGDGWTLMGFVADLYRQGSNDVAVYEVGRAGGDITLHRAG
jgi:hypothetical protein